MQQYNPKDWFGLIFKFHKSDTFRKLFWVMLSLAAYSVIVIYLELEVFKVEFTSTVMHSLLGFIISLLLVFRTNTAYDRWWEGRKQWGALVNVCRNILLKTYASKASESSKSRLKTFVIAYPNILKEHLRNTSHEQKIELLPEVVGNRHLTHVPNNIAFQMQLEIEKMKRKHRLVKVHIWHCSMIAAHLLIYAVRASGLERHQFLIHTTFSLKNSSSFI